MGNFESFYQVDVQVLKEKFPLARNFWLRIHFLRQDFFLLITVCVCLLVTGCGTLSNGRGWGEDAIYPIPLERIPRAAYHAFFDWQTLIPAAGALLFTVDHFDNRVSDWATKRHPLFGSEKGAQNASDYLYAGLQAEVLVTVLATPSGDDPKDWAYSKLKGIAVEGVALGVTAGTTTALQHTIHRTRPDESDSKSFPSNHSSVAFAAATLSNRNLDAIPLANEVRLPIQVGNIVLSTGVAWARVEGRTHYPSDVLAGAALGHFLSAFIHDAFLGLPEKQGFGLSVAPMRGGAVGQVFFSF